MLKTDNTFAIYCIPDKNNFDFADISHDHNLTFFKGSKIEHYLHLERITGKKFDNSLHRNLYFILKKLKLIDGDFDIIFVDNVIGRSCITEDGKVRLESIFSKKLHSDVEKAYAFWFEKARAVYVLNHELAHIYANIPFFGSFRENSLLLHFDGGASKSNFSLWHYKNGHTYLVDYGWKWKYLSNLFNANALNFFILNFNRPRHNSFPGSFMGYTAYGQADRKILQWLKDNNFFSDIWHDKKRFFKAAKATFGWDKSNFDPKDKFLQSIAATMQSFFTEEIIIHLKKFQQQTGAEYLYYSGGSALNISTNTAIVNSGIFSDIFIPPVPNDAGLSIGAGAYLQLKKGYTIELHSPYLNNFGIECEPLSDTHSESLIKRISELILQRNVIGLVRDCAEAGPRALGNRSIIALADSRDMYKRVSGKIKKRQWYRPLAPVMLERNAKLFTGLKNIHHLSKYMLLAFKILPKYVNHIPAVVHIDGTARIQTIFNRKQHPFLYDLLDYLDRKYNVKALINTSFNGKGQPIVHTCDSALKTAKNIGLDYLVCQNDIIEIK